MSIYEANRVRAKSSGFNHEKGNSLSASSWETIEKAFDVGSTAFGGIAFEAGRRSRKSRNPIKKLKLSVVAEAAEKAAITGQALSELAAKQAAEARLVEKRRQEALEADKRRKQIEREWEKELREFERETNSPEFRRNYRDHVRDIDVGERYS